MAAYICATSIFLHDLTVLSTLRSPCKMPLRHILARKLRSRIEQIEHVTQHTCALHKSQLLENEDAEFCPCDARRHWQIDKMEESIYRLLYDRQAVTSWFL